MRGAKQRSGGRTEMTLRGRAGYQNHQDAHNHKMPHATSRLRRMSTVLKHLDAATEQSSSSDFLEIRVILAILNRRPIDGTGSKRKELVEAEPRSGVIHLPVSAG
jgi:hypothetical protein